MVSEYDEHGNQQESPAAPPQPPNGVTAEAAGSAEVAGGTADPKAAERQRLLDQMAQLQAQLRETGDSAADEPFTRDTWGGRELLQCRYCPWTAFDEDAAQEHFASGTYREIHRQSPDFPG